MEEEPRTGLDRRTFLRRAALTGAAAAWAAPLVQTVTARPAFATTGTPVVECTHSTTTPSCMSSCHGSIVNENSLDVNPNSDPCAQICDAACPNECHGTDRLCVNNNFCDPGCWSGVHHTGQGACTEVTFGCSVSVSASYPCPEVVGTIPTFATNC